MRVLSRFVLAATNLNHFPPPTLPEIAFLGRSNVGKSSLINSLLNSKIARTSSQPGRTQSINFFEIRWPGKPQPELIFTDLPGYGYARVPREVSARWPEFIEPYLRERPSLALCIVLVDPNVPSQESDRQLFDFLRSTVHRSIAVATKSDRLSSNQLQNSMQSMAREFVLEEVVAFSARTGLGRDELWQHIRRAANHYHVREAKLSSSR